MGSSNLDRELHQAKNMWNAAYSAGSMDDGEEDFISSIELGEQRHRLGNTGEFKVIG